MVTSKFWAECRVAAQQKGLHSWLTLGCWSHLHNVTNGLTQRRLSHAINAFLQVKKRWEHPHHISPPQYLIACADAWFLRVVAFLPTLTLARPPATLHIALLFLALVIYLSMRRLPLDPSYPVAHFLPVGVCRIRCSLLVSCTCLLSWIVCLHDSKWLYLWFCSCLSFLSVLLFTFVAALASPVSNNFCQSLPVREGMRLTLVEWLRYWRRGHVWLHYSHVEILHVPIVFPEPCIGGMVPPELRRCLNATAPHNCFGQLAFVAIQCGSTMMYCSKLKHLTWNPNSPLLGSPRVSRNSLPSICLLDRPLVYSCSIQPFYPMILLLGGWIEKNMQCCH